MLVSASMQLLTTNYGWIAHSVSVAIFDYTSQLD